MHWVGTAKLVGLAKMATWREREREAEYAKWLHGLEPWTHAVTFTFLRRIRHFQATDRATCEAAIRHFLRILDFKCLGGKKAKKGYFVASAVTIHWGTYGDHPHAHLSLVAPAGIPDQKFLSYIEYAKAKTALLNEKAVIRAYRDVGWSIYLVEHGIDCLAISLLRSERAKPT
mgnify:CR=1 FL=1